MPQIFQVLCCYKCLVFQIHQTKKSNKFECKLCGEKQSIKRHYGIGTSKDCRHHVQRLNMIRGDQSEQKLKIAPMSCSSSDDDTENKNPKNKILPNLTVKNQRPSKSKWSNFVEEDDTPQTVDNSEEVMYLNDTEVVLEVPKKVKKFNAPLSSQNNKNSCKPSAWLSNDSSASTFHSLSGNKYIENRIAASSKPKLRDVETPVSNHLETAPNKIPPSPDKSNVSNKIRNSKWSQFVPPIKPGGPNTVVDNLKGGPNTIVQAQDMFALCNDEDLDNVLFMY